MLEQPTRFLAKINGSTVKHLKLLKDKKWLTIDVKSSMIKK